MPVNSEFRCDVDTHKHITTTPAAYTAVIIGCGERGFEYLVYSILFRLGGRQRIEETAKGERYES
jgi:hypothetical protein